MLLAVVVLSFLCCNGLVTSQSPVNAVQGQGDHHQLSANLGTSLAGDVGVAVQTGTDGASGQTGVDQTAGQTDFGPTDPMGDGVAFESAAGQTGFDPMTGFDQTGGQTGFDQTFGQASFDPSSGQGGFDPMGSQAAFDPQGGQTNFDQTGTGVDANGGFPSDQQGLGNGSQTTTTDLVDNSGQQGGPIVDGNLLGGLNSVQTIGPIHNEIASFATSEIGSEYMLNRIMDVKVQTVQGTMYHIRMEVTRAGNQGGVSDWICDVQVHDMTWNSVRQLKEFHCSENRSEQ